MEHRMGADRCMPWRTVPWRQRAQPQAEEASRRCSSVIHTRIQYLEARAEATRVTLLTALSALLCGLTSDV